MSDSSKTSKSSLRPPRLRGIVLKRTLTQVGALVALHSSWGPEAKWFCNPVLSCHSCALSWFACPIGVFVHYAGYRIFPFLAVGTLLVLGALFGRLFCGWVCPFGFLQDLLYRIPGPKIALPRWTNAIKYAALILLVFLLPFLLGESTWFSFCRICPASAIQVSLPHLIGGGSLTLDTAAKLAIFAFLLALMIAGSRSFCRLLCPIGAILAPFNKFSFWRVRPPKAPCTACSACNRACPTDDHPAARIERNVSPSRSLDCVVCHQCPSACPSNKRKTSPSECDTIPPIPIVKEDATVS